MKKSYLEPTLTLEQFLTEDVMVALFVVGSNVEDFTSSWFEA